MFKQGDSSVNRAILQPSFWSSDCEVKSPGVLVKNWAPRPPPQDSDFSGSGVTPQNHLQIILITWHLDTTALRTGLPGWH